MVNLSLADRDMLGKGFRYYVRHPEEGKIYSRTVKEMLNHLLAWELVDASIYEMGLLGSVRELEDRLVFTSISKARLFKKVRSGPLPAQVRIFLEQDKLAKRQALAARKDRRLRRLAKLAELPSESPES